MSSDYINHLNLQILHGQIQWNELAANDAVSKSTSTNGSKYGYGEAFQSEGLSHEFKASAGGKGSGSSAGT